MADQYQAALDKANAANESRYQGILSGYDDLRGRVMGDLQNVGQQERRDIDRTYRNMGSDVYQRLVNRGFGNSTIPGTMRQGVERERTAAYGRQNDRLLQQRAGYDTQLSQGKFGVMERRTDLGPDPNQLIALSQNLGQGGYGMPGGGMPMGVPPGAYQNMYANAMQQHMMGAMWPFMGGGGGGGYPPIRANVKAQETRRKRAGLDRIPMQRLGEWLANMQKFAR